MATVRWVGRQQARAQVTTVTVTAFDAATTYRLTVGVKDIEVPGTTNAAGTAAALAAAWNASAEPEFREATATSNGAVVTLTANTAGVPFTVSSSASGGTGTIGSPTTTVANKSPNDLGDAENYDTGSLPAADDTLVFEDGAVDVLWNLDALAGVGLLAVLRRASFTGRIGLPDYTAGGYYEYRVKELTLGARAGGTTVTVEESDGDAAQQVRINSGTGQTVLSVSGGGAGLLGSERVWWRGTHASNAAEVRGGSLAVATVAGQAATLTTLAAQDGVVRLGSSVTVATVEQSGGEVQCDSGVTTWTLTDQGLGRLRGTATLGALEVDGGSTFEYDSSGTLSALNVGGGGVVDFSEDKARTVSAAVVTAGATVRDRNKRVTWSNGIDLYRCGLEDVTLELGQHFSIQPSAI